MKLTTENLVKALRVCAKGNGCKECPLEQPCNAEQDYHARVPYLLEESAHRLQELEIENAQLRAVIAESDPLFFKHKCRICGCDWNHPCNDHDYWVEDDLCSACARKPDGSENNG